jgi:hypothetical protein
MYAMICIGFLVVVWVGFIHTIFRNVRRNSEMKRFNQKYYDHKINTLKSNIYGKEETSKETD